MAAHAPWAHPLGLVVLCASLALAILVAARGFPSLIPGAVLAWGLLAYAAVAFVAVRWPLRPSPPELQKLLAVRGAVAAAIRRRQRPGEPSGDPEISALLDQGLVHLDEEIAPALAQLLDGKNDLSDHLTLYETGKLPTPDPAVLERWRADLERE